MIRTFLSALGLAATVVQGASQSVTVCSAGECLTGNSNITRLGAVLSNPSETYILLPGQYTSSVQPATLEQALTSATSTLILTTGFGNNTSSSTTPSLPLNIALQPGLLNYPSDLYTGDPQFYQLPQNVNSTFNATSINRGSIILSSNTVAAIQANNNGVNKRIVLWDTVPYISQLPYDVAGNLQVVSIQSSACTTPCSSSSICSTSGTCICKPNFKGDSCDQCADGHYGPNCTPCDPNCDSCDAGITGTGTCLSVTLPSNAAQKCNCAHGTCSGNTCTCASGWQTPTTGTNTTQCSICQDGFFLDANGNCSACGARCKTCSDNTGTCTQCDNASLTPGARGNALQCSLTSTCATNEFLSGTTCTACNGACAQCFGPGASDCLLCAGNNVLQDGTCVSVSLTSGAAGICSGTTNLVANRQKGVCDVCPLDCAQCAYASFDLNSTQYSSVKCQKCQPGKFLSGGTCVATCPDGTFAADDGTCTACSGSCATCIGSATTCITCKNNLLASAGTCVSTCPTNSFSNSGKCTSCHPDCATCSGAGFNQCLSCPSSNPVLTSAKRCVTTCAKSEYFDESSATCKSCDSSCGSCSGGSSSSCLSCSSSTSVLRAGVCKTVNCGNGSGPTSGLGACLAELVQVPGNDSPPTSIPPVDPNSQQPSSGSHKLTWWQILLIVLGILFLLAIILFCWRRRQRKKRAQETEQFKQNMEHRGFWSKLRNPFSAWRARRRAAAINRRSRSDLENRTDKDWRNTQSDPYTPGPYGSPGLSSERRPAVNVPRSIGHTSWITMGQQDGRSYMGDRAPAGLGAIRERDEADRYTNRSGRSGSYRSRRDEMSERDRRAPHDDYRPGESKYWGQEIEQDDLTSLRTRTDQTYLKSGITADPYQFERPSSRNSDDRTDLVSIIKSEGVSERWDDRDRRRQYERSRSGYERSERSRPYDERSYRTRTDIERSYRQDYPASVSTESQSRSYDRERYDYSDSRRGFGSSSASHGPETPSMYSQPTLPRVPPLALATFEDPPRDAVLSSRFSMSTAAASTRPPPKRKEVPREPMPPLEAPRKLTDAEMYKMSKLFPDLLGLMSPTKKSPPASVGVKSPSRNPFRI